jgi:hypothetical protein
MALTRVQVATARSTSGVGTASVSFSSPPTVGNGVLLAILNTGGATTGCSDNRGNTYTRAVFQAAATNHHAAIYLCASIGTSAGPFTVSVALPGGLLYYTLVLIEVGNVGTGLVSVQTQSGTGFSAAASTGTTAGLGAAEVFLLAAVAVGAAEASIVVGTVTPPWTQEAETLDFTTGQAGEQDSRILTGASGTTQTVSWTLASGQWWSAVLGAFAGTTPTAPTVRTTQVALEVFNAQSATVRSTQLALEVFYPIAVPARLTQTVVELFLVSPAPLRMTQHLVELFLGPLPPCTTGEFPIDPVTRAVRRWRPR